MEILKSDVLVIGGGGAGMRAALAAKEEGADVLLVSKTPMGKSTCTYVSGGAFSVAVEGFSEESHLKDTLRVGRGINFLSLVETLVKEAPERVRELERLGLKGGKWSKGRFACQGKISAWGAPLTGALTEACRAQGVSEKPWVMISDLFMKGPNVAGALGFDFRRGIPVAFQSRATILANGGAGALYLRNDNPVRMTGDGYALAFRAGCSLRDMEFVQFLPVGLAEPGMPSHMVAVSLADAGKIVTSEGENLLQKYGITDRPVAVKCRDTFSQAIFKEEREGKQVFIDLRSLSDEDWPKDIVAQTQRNLLIKNLSCRQKPLRLSPVCHFFIGGVSADENGRTNVPGLYAAGEVVGGLHGANRMGGNALAEIIVFGARTGKTAGRWALEEQWTSGIQGWAESKWREREKELRKANGSSTPRSLRRKLAEVLWREGGISRDERGLQSTLPQLGKIREKLPQAANSSPKEILEKMELENALLVSEMIVQSALLRRESRGAHFRTDFPQIDDENWKGNIFLWKKEQGMRLSFRPLEKKTS